METKRCWQREAQAEFQNGIFQEDKNLEERLSKEEVELLEKKQRLERMHKDRRYAKVEEGREKLAAKSEVTRAAGSGSQTSEMGAEPVSAEVETREEDMGHSKNQYMEDMAESRWYAKMDGGREKLAAARNGSRDPEMDARHNRSQ